MTRVHGHDLYNIRYVQMVHNLWTILRFIYLYWTIEYGPNIMDTSIWSITYSPYIEAYYMRLIFIFYPLIKSVIEDQKQNLAKLKSFAGKPYSAACKKADDDI